MKIRSVLCLFAGVVTVSFCLSLAAQTSSAVNRVTGPIDESQLVPLKGNVARLAAPALDRGPAPVSTPTGQVLLLLERSATQQQALTEYLEDVQNPGSPSYHKWLTPAQYGARFGVSDADLTAVESWLEGHGFRIERVPAGRNVIAFSGDFGEIESAFHTSMHMYALNGKTLYGNVADPQIPAALAPVVAGVGPLNNFHAEPPLVMGPRGQYDSTTHRIQPALTLTGSNNAPLLFLDPADASTIYDTPNAMNANFTSGTSYDGSGVSIGIAGASDLTMGDVENYRTAFLGETTNTVNLPTVVVEGNDPGLVSGWDTEALLDNEVAGGLAPKAKIYFYTAADTDISSGLLDAIFRAVDDNTVSILSLSVEACEPGIGTTGNQEILEGSEQAAAQGITVVVAAGDNGSAACDDFDTATAAQDGFAVNGYASTPYVVAVGGTDFDGLPAAFSTYASTSLGSAPYYRTALKYIPENPWNDSTTVNTTYSANVAAVDQNGDTNIVAGSGGKSSVYAKPSFQGASTPNDSVRDVPDVALFAGNGGYDAAWVLCSDSTTDGATESYTECLNTNGVFSNATLFGGVGGTSAAAPAFAGIMALVAEARGSASDNYRLGQVDNVLYQQVTHNYSAVFHDITTGNNAVYCATGSANCGSNHFMLGYNAGTGYDLASGLGSVDATALVNDWASAVLTSTSTTLKLNGSTASYSGVHGANVTFAVGVTPSGATGAAAIVDTADETAGGTAQGPQNNGQLAIALSGGAGTAAYNGLPGGTYAVYARYGGDSTDAASSSTAINVDISAEASTTDLAVDAYNPQTGNGIAGSSYPYGTEIVADAQIVGTAEGANTQGHATGNVTFLNGSATLGTGALNSSDVASFPPLTAAYTAFAPGAYSMTAKYAGDASYDASTSSAVAFTVTKAATSTAASASPTTVSAGGSTTISVTVSTPENAGAGPTGTVALQLGSTTLATISHVTVSTQTSGSTVYDVLTGSGTVQASQLAGGSNTIDVNYSGDGNYAASSTTVAVTAPGSSGSAAIALTNGGNITVAPGASSGNTSTITVTPSGGFTGGVNLSCAVTTGIDNPTDPPTCSVPASVTISGTTAATATLTVTTTAASSAALAMPQLFLGGGATLAMLFFFGVPGRRRAWRGLFMLVAIALVGGAIGCGNHTNTTTGGGHNGTTTGTYTVTVTGKDTATGQITSSTAVTLTVD